MIRTDRGGLAQDLWLAAPSETEHLPQPGRDLPPSIPGEPIEAHLRSLYPQHVTEQQRLAFGYPGTCFGVLSSPANFRQELGELVAVFEASSTADDRDVCVLLHELWVNRALLESYFRNLLKA